jgi:hypothetical protein
LTLAWFLQTKKEFFERRGREGFAKCAEEDKEKENQKIQK